MARTFGALITDKVQAATSASLDTADPIQTTLIEVYPTALTGNRVMVSHQTPGVSGWTFRLSGTSGDINFLHRRATTNLQSTTNDTPMSSLNTWRRVAVVSDLSGAGVCHIYHDKVTPGTLAEATYSVTNPGAGAEQGAAGQAFVAGNLSDSTVAFQGRIGRVAMFKRILTLTEINAWFAKPRGDDPDCVAFWCLGSSSAEIDFSGTTSATMKRNNGTVTGATVSDGSALPPGLVLRTVGSASRMVAHPTNVVTDWLASVSLSSVTGNFRYLFEMYKDSVFTFTGRTDFIGFVADPATVADFDDATFSRCCVHFRPAAGQGFSYPTKGSGVKWQRTDTVSTGNNYWCFSDVPGLLLEGIEMEYTGAGAVTDADQLRGLRIDYAAAGGSPVRRMWFSGTWNTTRPGASVVVCSVPGGVIYDSIVDEVGVGQDVPNTRAFSAGPNAAYTSGFVNCTAGHSGGEGFRIVPNHAAAIGIVYNCVGFAADGTGCFFFDRSLSGSILESRNASGDATADDDGDPNAIINIVPTSEVVDYAGKNFRLKTTSRLIGAGAQVAGASKVDIMGVNYAALAAPDLGAAQSGIILSFPNAGAGVPKHGRWFKGNLAPLPAPFPPKPQAGTGIALPNAMVEVLEGRPYGIGFRVGHGQARAADPVRLVAAAAAPTGRGIRNPTREELRRLALAMRSALRVR